MCRDIIYTFTSHQKLVWLHNEDCSRFTACLKFQFLYADDEILYRVNANSHWSSCSCFLQIRALKMMKSSKHPILHMCMWSSDIDVWKYYDEKAYDGLPRYLKICLSPRLKPLSLGRNIVEHVPQLHLHHIMCLKFQGLLYSALYPDYLT